MRKVADVEPVRVWARRANMASTSPRKMAAGCLVCLCIPSRRRRSGNPSGVGSA